MKIYLVSRTDNVDYDQFDSFVVTASTSEEAIEYLNSIYNPDKSYSDWSRKVKVEFIGVATDEYTEPTVILGSFNAG